MTYEFVPNTVTHVDGRGAIHDLLGPVDAVTLITTVAGAVRGNHVHRLTTQWVFVISGQLHVRHGDEALYVLEGDLLETPPGVAHAWKALGDTTCLVFARGPRAGAAYESDTVRLAEPLLT